MGEYTGNAQASAGAARKEPRRRRRSAAPPTRIEQNEPTLAPLDFVRPDSAWNHESRAGRNNGPDQPVAPTDAVHRGPGYCPVASTELTTFWPSFSSKTTSTLSPS
jgi:hypothetical protein